MYCLIPNWGYAKLNPSTTTKQMHILQPKHIRLNNKQAEDILTKFNISKNQLPKILSSDITLPEGCEVGDIIQVERKEGSELNIYYRVVV